MHERRLPHILSGTIIVKYLVVFLFGFSLILAACGNSEVAAGTEGSAPTVPSTRIRSQETASKSYQPTPPYGGAIGTSTVANFRLSSPCISFWGDATPIPEPAAPGVETILEPAKAIEYSDQLLMCRGLVPFPHVGGIAFPLHLENEGPGTFVALGYGPRLGGFQLLYRVHGETVQLESLESSQVSWEAAPTEYLDLFPQGTKSHIFKLTGTIHQGTGLLDRVFEIVEVSVHGARNLFNGTLVSTSEHKGGYIATHNFAFTDLDRDGIKEIIETGESCAYDQGSDLVLGKTDCHPLSATYWYDGTRYSPIH